MVRLIDADALRDALGITGTKDSCKGCQYNKRFNFACNTYDAPSFAYVCEAIDNAPTVDWEEIKRQMKAEEQKIKDAKKAELKARRKMVFDLRTSGMSITKISKKIGKSTYVVSTDIDEYLFEKSKECNETCINCKHLKLSDHLDVNGKPWNDVDRYCTKLKREVYGMSFCDNYEQIEHPRCLCEECVNYVGLYYPDDSNYIRCKIHGRWTANSTCSCAERKK